MRTPQVIVFPDVETLSHAAAAQFTFLVQQKSRDDRPFMVALNGGGTPQRLFELLGQSPYREQINWEVVHIFWGDERCVPPDAPGSNYGQAWQAWLRHVPIPATNIHRIQGELTPHAAAADYTIQLKAFSQGESPWPVFDLILLGMGDDGHTASLFPGAMTPEQQIQPVLAVTAAYEGRPAHRITLTPLVFNQARHIWVMVTGAKKARIVAAALHGPHQPEHLPMQRIQPEQGKLTWMLDDAAAAQLPSTQRRQ